MSRALAVLLGWGRGLSRRLLSVPVFLKILGIGLVVGAVFGSVTLYQTRTGISYLLYQALEEKTLATTRALAATLERPLITGDLVSVKQLLTRARKTAEDTRFMVVLEPSGQAVAHTFDRRVPPDLLQLGERLKGAERFQVLQGENELLFVASAPLLKGYAGTVLVGVSDARVQQELESSRLTLLWTLVLCLALGTLLALMLTHILTRPLHQLTQAAHRIGEGDFAARASIGASDELGQLAWAFNQMAESLGKYRLQVEEKEAARVALIEQIVQTQEEERKRIARELHDHLGQSLSALLISLHAGCCARGEGERSACDAETRVRQLIDEVRRLAWGIRPSILDDYGLEAALGRYVEEIARGAGVQFDFQYSRSEGTPRLPLRVEVTLYRIAQEAITNLLRHARARHASVVVLHSATEATMLVEDDGCGFDVEVVRGRPGLHLGLTGMEERVMLLGAAFAIDASVGRGTLIRVRVPLGEIEHGHSHPDRR